MSELRDLLSVLDLEEVTALADGRATFRADSVDEGHGVVFGGQLLAQSLAAAARCVPGKEAKSVHQVFARGGDPSTPLDIDVTIGHEGRAFASVLVAIRQGGKLCTHATVWLHAPDDDLVRHQPVLPAELGPADRWPERRPGSWWEIRVVDDVDISDPALVGPAELDVWTRFPDAPPADLATSQALLAYASDGFLIGTAMRPHAGVGQAQAHVSVSTTVLTHTLTFHEPFSAADWLLLRHEAPYAGRGRAYGRAHAFAADGRLVASYGQESMLRAMPEAHRPPPGERARA